MEHGIDRIVTLRFRQPVLHNEGGMVGKHRHDIRLVFTTTTETYADDFAALYAAMNRIAREGIADVTIQDPESTAPTIIIRQGAEPGASTIELEGA